MLRLFLLSTLDAADVRILLTPVADDSAQELERLRAAMATANAGPRLSFDRLATEFSIRSVQALHDWAMWALAELDR